MRFLTSVTLAVFLIGNATPVFGQGAFFKTFEGGFSVQLPGEPWYETRKLGESAIIQHQFHYESKDGKAAHMAGSKLRSEILKMAGACECATLECIARKRR